MKNLKIVVESFAGSDPAPQGYLVTIYLREPLKLLSTYRATTLDDVQQILAEYIV